MIENNKIKNIFEKIFGIFIIVFSSMIIVLLIIFK